jgi:hypothetical protein
LQLDENVFGRTLSLRSKGVMMAISLIG